MAHDEHEKAASGQTAACAVLTCSDTRTPENDVSGQSIIAMLRENGHEVVHYEIIRDEPATIRQLIKQLSRRLDVHCVFFNGGTGVSRRDNTFDAVSGELTKVLPGFGELFRVLSYESIGPAAMLSRAIGGIVLTQSDRKLVGEPDPFAGREHTIVYSIPGSPQAVELAMTRLILPTLSHLVWEIGR
jgi:molybdenum cofactor biosynthesis protein B